MVPVLLANFQAVLDLLLARNHGTAEKPTCLPTQLVEEEHICVAVNLWTAVVDS